MTGPSDGNTIEADVARMVIEAARRSPNDVLGLLDVMIESLDARTARLFVADYSLRRLQHLDTSGSTGEPIPIAGTLIGRVFMNGEIQTSGEHPTLVSVPLQEGSCPLGVLEFDIDVWDDRTRDLIEPLVAIFVMAWIVKGRYTDIAARARRSEPLSAAAEVHAIATQFGDSYYVTGVIGTFEAETGILRWVNAGHVLPMLVRNGTFAGPLRCTPSLPFGLGGSVLEVAEHRLQRGDRVLFYTDGITEARLLSERAGECASVPAPGARWMFTTARDRNSSSWVNPTTSAWCRAVAG